MAIGDKETKPTLAAPPSSEPRAKVNSNEYILTGDEQTDIESIASHYKPADLDDVTWKGMWKGIYEGESGSNLQEGESRYGKLPKGQRAQGGMQVLPKTAKGLGFTEEEFKDPYYRFMAGVKNLRTDWDELGKDKRITSPDHRAALTFAAYHAGRGNVLASLDRNEDGVPNVDDGGINTRDYTLKKVEYLQRYLQENGAPQSEEPGLLTDEEVAQKYSDETGAARESGQQPGDVQQRRAGSVLLGNLNQTGARKSFEEELVDMDRRVRENLGLIVPATAPRNFTGKVPKITMEVRRAEDGSLQVDEQTLSDAVVFALTGDNTLGQRFRQDTGENPGTFAQEITNQWLNEQTQAGNLQVSEVDGRIFVQGNIPVENYVKNRLEAYSKEGKPGVDKITAEMKEETAEYERIAAEDSYGRRIMELRAQADKIDEKKGKITVEEQEVTDGVQPILGTPRITSKSNPEAVELRRQADALEAELEARYPTNWMDETWKGFKTGLARGLYNVNRSGANLKGIVEALNMDDKDKKEADNRDKRVRRMEQALNAETPQARRWLGQAAEAVTQELVYAPMYISGGMMLGPSGGVITSAIRSANKPLDEAMQDIAASVFELGAGNLIKGKWIAGTGVSPRKEFLAEMASGGVSEAGGDALIELAQGKAIDWNNALMNLVIGGAMEAGTGAREAIKNQARPEGEGAVKFGTAEPTAFDTEVRSPVFVTRGEDGQPRFGAVIRQGPNVGFVEIPSQHPIILKHTMDVDEGKASFIASDVENFETALTEWKSEGEGEIQIPKLSVAQLSSYIRQRNAAVNDRRDAKLKTVIENGVTDEGQNVQGNDELRSGTQRQQEGQKQSGEEAEKENAGNVPTEGKDNTVSSGQVLSGESAQLQSGSQATPDVLKEKPKTFRRYKSQDYGLDEDLAKQWDVAKAEYDRAYKASANADAEVKPGIAIKAGHVFTNVRRDILKEQERRDKAKESKKPEPKKTTTPGEESFKAGRVVKTGGAEVRLPPDLSSRWQRVQDDFKAVSQSIRDDKDLGFLEKQKRTKEANQERTAEQRRIISELQAREKESQKRGYLKGSDRPLEILEDNGEELTVKLAGEDATRVSPREQVETRKERVLNKSKGKLKLPLSVRAKSTFGTFKEGRQASYASNGVVYINNTMQSKIEDALNTEIYDGFTFKENKIDDAIKVLRDKGLTKVADQLEAQKKESNNKPALVNVTNEEAATVAVHERIHQRALGKDLPRTVLERIVQEGKGIDTLLQEADPRHPIKEVNAYDVVQEVLAYGLTGDYESLGVEPDFLYDALLDVIQAYIETYPNEDLDAIFDIAVIDVDTVRNEANRRIKYESEKQSSSKNVVQKTGDKAEGRKETGSDADTKKPVREKESGKFGLGRGEGHILNEVWKLVKANPSIKTGAPVSVEALREQLSDLSKEDFDKAIENLAESGDVFVHRHDFAQHLPEEDRDKLVKIKDNYYVAITIPERTSFGFNRATVQDDYEALEEIKRKPIEDIDKNDIKTVVKVGRFAAISGGKKTGQLKKELQRMGYKTFEAEGSYQSGKEQVNEPSLFVILGSRGDEANMIRLASRFNQADVLLGDNGAYRSPFTESAEEYFNEKTKPVFGPDAKKSSEHTIVSLPSGEVAFSIPNLETNTRATSVDEQKELAELTRAYEKSFEGKTQSTTADLTAHLQQQADLGKRKKRSVRAAAKFLESTVQNMYGKYPNENLPQSEYDAIRTRRGVADLISILKYELGQTKKNADQAGMTWYTSSIRNMHDRTGIAFPEVLNVPQARILFDLTLALSSPANSVASNYKYAVKIWDRLVKEFELGKEGTGPIYPTKQKDKTRDKRTGQMRQKRYGRFGPLLDKFNNLSQGYIPISSKEVEEYSKKGLDVKRTKDFAGVDGAQQFYAEDPELQRYIKKYGHIGGVFEYLLQPGTQINEPYKATELLGPKVGAFFLNIAGFSQLVTVDSWISRWFYMLNGGLVNENSAKGIQDSPKGKDGDLIRGIMQAAAKEWNSKYGDVQKLEPEDVQAMTWYHIKNLMHLAGAADSGNVDFAQAASAAFRDVELVSDIDGGAADRRKVLDKFVRTSPTLGPRASVAGTESAAKENRDFFMQQMAMPARMGLAHTKRKDIVNKKLSAFDSKEWNKFAERAKGGEVLTPEEKTKLYDLLQKGYRATTEKERLKVKEELLDFTNNISAQGVAEFILTLRKAGMLSGVKTTGRNILSNLAFGALEEFQRGSAASMDVAISLATGKERTVQGISPVGIYKSAVKAFSEGLPKAWETFAKGNADMTNFEDIGYDPKLRPFLKIPFTDKRMPFATGAWFMNKTVGNFAKYVFRFQKAQDVFFKTYAYNRALYEVAALKKKNQGIPIKDTLSNPSAQDSDVAWRAAEVMVFQNENAMNTAYQRFKSKQPKVVKYLLDYQLPFIKTGSNIFARTMDYLGIGGAYKVAKLFKDLDDEKFDTFKKKAWEAIDNPVSRKVIIEAFSRGLVGLGIASIGAFLAAKGLLNGMDDDDEKERQKRIAEGSGPGHIKIGGMWHDIRGISPVGTILLSGASAHRALTKDLKDESKRFDAALAVASSIVVDGLPLARFASDYVNPKSGRSVVQRLIGAESIIPALVAEYAAHRDTVQRNTKGDTLGETIKKSVKARVPVKREELPAKTDVFGRELEQPSGFNPLSSKDAKDDKVVKEAVSVGWSMTPPKRDTKNKETAQEFEIRKKKTQDLIYRLFTKVVNDPGYSSDFTKPERKEILDESAGIARRTVQESGKLTDSEMKDIVQLVLEKAKEESSIERDTKLDKEEKKRAKQSVSSSFSKFISGPTKD